MLQKITKTGPAGTLGANAGSRRIAAGHFPKALERNHAVGGITHPISTKPAFQGVGSVLGGPVQRNDKVNSFVDK
jgi:hypothetical protein